MSIYSELAKLDKFYTKQSVSIECIKHLDLSLYDYVIEPSAGNGSFSNNITHKNLLALDINPEHDDIKQMDWFNYSHNNGGKVLVCGNPPFGKRNYLSKKFIKHSLTFAQTIAFILPNVFNKYTNQKIFPKNWRLIKIIQLPINSFTVDGSEHHVPCSFFIFDKSDGENLMFDVSKYETCDDFVWCEKKDADLFIMGASLKLKKPCDVTENNRGYYLKSLIGVSDLILKLNATKWNGFSSANGGVSWLTKSEIIKTYTEQYELHV